MSKFSEEESVQKEPEKEKEGCGKQLGRGCLLILWIPLGLFFGLIAISFISALINPSESPLSSNSPSDSPSTPQNGCENAMMAAASVPSSQDTLEDTDQAFVACNSVQEFVDASKKYPDALNGANEQIYIDNRCQVPYLKKTPLCKSRQ